MTPSDFNSLETGSDAPAIETVVAAASDNTTKSVLYVLKEGLAETEEVEGVGDCAECGVVCLYDSDDEVFVDVV